MNLRKFAEIYRIASELGDNLLKKISDSALPKQLEEIEIILKRNLHLKKVDAHRDEITALENDLKSLHDWWDRIKKDLVFPKVTIESFQIC